MHLTRLPGSLVILAGLAGAAGCDGHQPPPTGPEPLPPRFIVSDPVSNASAVLRAGHELPDLVAASLAAAAATGTVYVSLPPGSIPGGEMVIVLNPRTGSTATAVMIDGGFDPIAIQANPGEVLEFEIRLAQNGGTRYSVTVPTKRPPRVVRTYPPRGKRDVALNTSILVVFSEPVDAGTLTSSSVRLLRGTTAVAGSVAPIAGNSVAAEFVPAAPLEANATYQLEVTTAVRDLDGDGLEAGVAVEFATGASSPDLPAVPAAPSGLRARASSSAVAHVMWTDNAINEERYRVERSATGTGPWDSLTTFQINPPGSTGDVGTVVFPTSEQRMCYRVVAFNKSGDSPPSGTDCATPPAGPTNLRRTVVDDRTVDLVWTDNSGVETSYELWRSDSGIVATLPPSTTSFRDSDLSPNTRYTYLVRAHREDDVSDYSNVADVLLTTTPPGTPRVTVYPASSSSVYVSPDGLANAEGYRVSRSTDNGATWVNVGTITELIIDFIDGPVTSEQRVCYQVIAFNTWGESPPSDAACTVPPRGPTLVSVTPVTDGTAAGSFLDIVWTDNSAIEDDYGVWVSSGDGWWLDLIGSVPANATSARVRWMERVDRLIQGVPVSAIIESYAVYAIKDGGRSDGAGFLPPLPLPPQLTATVVSASEIDLAWTTQAIGYSFTLERCQGDQTSCGDADFAVIFQGGSLVYRDRGLQSKATYTYRVRRVAQVGASGYSNTASATTP
jgi:Big-like domain-containing protein/fibronectin type III domain protein